MGEAFPVGAGSAPILCHRTGHKPVQGGVISREVQGRPVHNVAPVPDPGALDQNNERLHAVSFAGAGALVCPD